MIELYWIVNCYSALSAIHHDNVSLRSYFENKLKLYSRAETQIKEFAEYVLILYSFKNAFRYCLHSSAISLINV